MSSSPQVQKTFNRVEIINVVKTYLGFFVFLVLVVEATFGALALTASGNIQILAFSAMLFILIALIAIVCFFAYMKPDALLSYGGNREIGEFCSRILGQWWERIRPDESSALSFVEVSADKAANTVKLNGRAYNRNAELAALWESEASCVKPHERKVFYYWKGWHPSRPQEPYEGFGEISFRDSPGPLDNAIGVFSDSNLIDMKSTTKKSTEFRRCMDDESKRMQQGNSREIADLIQNKLDHWP